MQSQGVPVSSQEHKSEAQDLSGSLSVPYLLVMARHLPIALSLCDPGTITSAEPHTDYLLDFQPLKPCAKEPPPLTPLTMPGFLLQQQKADCYFLRKEMGHEASSLSQFKPDQLFLLHCQTADHKYERAQPELKANGGGHRQVANAGPTLWP